VRKAIKKFGAITREEPNALGEGPSEKGDELDENDIVSLLQSWMGGRPSKLNSRTIRFADVDQELGLPRGSAEKHIETAAHRWGYTAERRGKTTILFQEQRPRIIG
jgi:hypothetical protein